jgi:branched-chain amino acid aminotransferase
MTPATSARAAGEQGRPADAAWPAVWIDGRRQPAGAAHVSALDRGLTLADGVFETMRGYAGVVFRLGAHLARLEHATAALDIPLPRTARETVLEAVAHAVGGGLGDVAVRLTVTRGAGGGGVAPPLAAAAPPTVIVSVGPLPSFAPALYDAGLAAHVVSGRRNERAMTAGLKTLAYTDAVAALIEARRAGADEALFLDTEGHCSEAASSNLFAATRDGALLTPPLSCGALPGITRAAVIELARARGVRVEERAFGLPELLGAREAFLTSSLRELAPLVRVNGQAIGDGAPGPLTRDLAAAFGALVRQECGA